MSDFDDGGPAFPTELLLRSGLSVRDYFAAKAMQGFIASIGVVGGTSPTDEDLARYSYDIADAMLRARENS